jgi:hypothetical protein
VRDALKLGEVFAAIAKMSCFKGLATLDVDFKVPRLAA